MVEVASSNNKLWIWQGYLLLPWLTWDLAFGFRVRKNASQAVANSDREKGTYRYVRLSNPQSGTGRGWIFKVFVFLSRYLVIILQLFKSRLPLLQSRKHCSLHITRLYRRRVPHPSIPQRIQNSMVPRVV